MQRLERSSSVKYHDCHRHHSPRCIVMLKKCYLFTREKEREREKRCVNNDYDDDGDDDITIMKDGQCDYINKIIEIIDRFIFVRL